MTEAEENDPVCINEELLSDQELPSYQLPRDGFYSQDENSPARLPSCRLDSPERAYSFPVFDNQKRENRDRGNTCSAPDVLQKSSFKALGMADKDISWASSMESIVGECSPRNDFNTIEKATFFPDPAAVQVKFYIKIPG